jgi:hypothetical protein
VVALLNTASVYELLDVVTVLAGHGYEVGGTPRSEPRGEDAGSRGIGTTTIVAVVLLTLVTIGLLVWLSPARARVKLRAAAPMAFTAVIIAAPLLAWAASSGGDDDKPLIVERSTSVDGAPEILVSLEDDELNSLETTRGKRAIRVQCLADDGEVVVDGRQRWPFVEEPGFDAPHAHQPASREQLRRTERCRLQGTRARLEAEIRGPVPG